MSSNDALNRVVEQTKSVLLDFDGPICNVFAGFPASTIAAELRSLLASQGVSLTDKLMSENDPLEVLRYTASLGKPDLTHTIEEALRAAELAAVKSAVPTPYAREVIVAAKQIGRPVAIVSNNSADAIRAYLEAHRLAAYVHPVIGRAHSEPSQMKPNPAPLQAAIEELKLKPESCLFVGDSKTDLESARAAGIHILGYVHKPNKAQQLRDADATVETLADLALALMDNE